MRLRLFITALLAVAGLTAAGCGGASDSSTGNDSSSSGSTKLSLVAYSTPQVVYDDAIPAFQKTAAGKGVGFDQSYGASGDQSRAVAGGLPADVVEFSLAPDMKRLVDAGLVDANWSANAHKGFVTDSVVALIVRKGNPKGIHTWADLLKPGIKVVTPNPFTSGAAKWNLLGAYVYGGLPFVKTLLTQHVTVQPKSGRDALQTFTSGQGDVLISYENEAITAQQKGEKVDYVVPDENILIQNPLAVTKNTKHPTQAKAFVNYLWSTAGQTFFGKHGYRPVDPAVAKKFSFPTPKKLKTIDDLGGWDKVDPQFFDPTNGSIAKIEQDAGVSTAK
ncbi:MAG: extracellular solute-binding protein [Solirubrobacteraceae bacterium]|nr:extracellular solute-binding protein [Solirubrobacteraceae bacterium]